MLHCVTFSYAMYNTYLTSIYGNEKKSSDLLDVLFVSEHT